MFKKAKNDPNRTYNLMRFGAFFFYGQGSYIYNFSLSMARKLVFTRKYRRIVELSLYCYVKIRHKLDKNIKYYLLNRVAVYYNISSIVNTKSTNTFNGFHAYHTIKISNFTCVTLCYTIWS